MNRPATPTDVPSLLPRSVAPERFLSGWKSGDELENWFDRTGRIIVPAATESHAESAESAEP